MYSIYRGDTAVYLLFAYARVASILRKAKDERQIDLQNIITNSNFVDICNSITYNDPSGKVL